MPTDTTARDRLAAAGGAALGTTFRVAGRLRPAAKPLHPAGRLRHGTLVRTGLTPAVGAPLLDERGSDPVLVRLSRAVGLPAWLPDVQGLAVRVETADGHGDLLFASTGWGRLTRFVLTPARRPEQRPMTTLLPYRTGRGLVVLGARLDGDDGIDLACAVGGGGFRRFGRIELFDDAGDPEIAFDPVRAQLPGLRVPTWVERLREPAYAGARGTRDRATSAEPTTGPHA